MAGAVIDQKLESLRLCVERVKAKLPETVEALKQDIDAQDIVALNLTRAVQICIDIATHWLAENTDTIAPKTMGQAFDNLAQAGVIELGLAQRMKKAVGFRNVMVHSYQDVEWAIVHAIGSRHLNDFIVFARAMASYSDPC